MKTEESSILYDFTESLLKHSNKKVENLSQAINSFLNDKDNCKNLLDSIDTNLRQPFLNKIKMFQELEYLDGNKDLESAINIAFDDIKDSIQNIYNDGNAQMYKEVVIFF
ncbi:hypothetical protein DCO58_01885 [Helicobacter saguini]|uniref:Uncharacterized protein n=1 Tax=Helicobacter saguini TaxID=1548018 RepID=A0A4U8T4V8_9HELI|nr:hypothetical protein [Helicobacter saguini]MWV62869.1 hypothetical protein [Helicobacter saguini]MWV66461.1 hypothetical protein [Helicobacter saguini]MWV68810.1 hypothetical protein [Helicobacter saguini]MWV71635.1 hypothetical protein [Helicobacter saguini]TLD94438.1 hypothetical protein LS64_005785 [Helicobacter saguini]